MRKSGLFRRTRESSLCWTGAARRWIPAFAGLTKVELPSLGTPPLTRHAFFGGIIIGFGLFASACNRAAPEVELPVGTSPGQSAPDLDGTLPAGEPFSLAGLEGPASTVLVFYRSAECGLCRLQLDQMQANISAYERVNARVVGVTLDAPETNAALLGQAELGYPLVSVDTATFERWGVLGPDQETVLPATYVVDAEGVVRFQHIGRDAADRTTDAEMVTVLETLRSSQSAS
jgi:peroxiredoxin